MLENGVSSLEDGGIVLDGLLVFQDPAVSTKAEVLAMRCSGGNCIRMLVEPHVCMCMYIYIYIYTYKYACTPNLALFTSCQVSDRLQQSVFMLWQVVEQLKASVSPGKTSDWWPRL